MDSHCRCESSLEQELFVKFIFHFQRTSAVSNRLSVKLKIFWANASPLISKSERASWNYRRLPNLPLPSHLQMRWKIRPEITLLHGATTLISTTMTQIFGYHIQMRQMDFFCQNPTAELEFVNCYDYSKYRDSRRSRPSFRLYSSSIPKRACGFLGYKKSSVKDQHHIVMS